MEKKYVMAIDQGTTGTRVIFFDRAGTVRGAAYREIRQIFPRPGWVEHDPGEIWQTVIDCSAGAMSAGGIEAGEIASVGITNQRETTVLWDSETGEPVHNAIVWQCRRTAPMCEELKSAGHGPAVSEKTGLVIDAYFSATKIRWVLDNVPEARELAGRGRLRMGTIDTWIIWNLTGGGAHLTDYSNGSRTMLLNVHTLDWDDDLLEMTGVPRSVMPGLVPSSGVMAKTDPGGFLGAEVPIAGDAGDQQAATFGQTCFRPGMAKSTFGTALGLMMNIGGGFKASEHGLTTDILWHLGTEPTYSFEGLVFIGGAVVQWLRDGLRIIDDAAESSEMALKVPDTGGVYIVPAFTGLSTPYWDMYARGTIVGITRGTSREHLARAALESMAYQARDVLGAMEADSGERAESLRVDGGATASDFLMQFQADVLGVPVERPAVTEMTALGAAYLAGLGVGFWEGTDELESHWKLDRAFEPAMPEERREELYAGWKRAVERSLGWAK